MNKPDRLAYIRERARTHVALSPVAATLLEELQAEDKDLGSVDAFGVLPPDDVQRENAPLATEDESESNVTLISPLMREAVEA